MAAAAGTGDGAGTNAIRSCGPPAGPRRMSFLFLEGVLVRPRRLPYSYFDLDFRLVPLYFPTYRERLIARPAGRRKLRHPILDAGGNLPDRPLVTELELEIRSLHFERERRAVREGADVSTLRVRGLPVAGS